MNVTSGELKGSFIVGQTSLGAALRGTLLKLTRAAVVFEMYNPTTALRLSEVLQEFRIILNDRTLYSGKAVVRNLMNTSPAVVVCEATLSDGSWCDLDFAATNGQPGKWREEYLNFTREWQKFYRVLPEFKSVMADMQSFLMDLQLWLGQVELEVRSSPSMGRVELERKIIDELAGQIGSSIDVFINRFETIATGLDDDLQPMHRTYLRRQLHPLLLCSPFAYRTFHKPLGYAGDYEMVDMMLRPPYEGSTLFAKIINVWLLGQAPATAHRNRVTYLTRKLVDETLRTGMNGSQTRVFNLGCGPAAEVQRFLEKERVSDRVKLTLTDFNEETLRHLHQTLEDIKRKQQRQTTVHLVKKTVHQILKESGRPSLNAPENQFDFIYCAGLFDYLPDPVCKRLMNAFYEMLAAGGLLVATNVSDAMNATRPFRYSMEYILDWHLIYRNGHKMAELMPGAANPDYVSVITENTGVNVFMEVRKPENG